MKALILAAGEGTRMEPLTHRCPKPMLPIAGRPVVGHILDALAANRINDVLLLVGANRQRLEEMMDTEGLYDRVRFIEQRQRLGTGHAVLQAERYAEGGLLVVNGDIVANAETVKRVVASAKRGADVVVASASRSDLEKYGVLKCRPGKEDMVVEGIIEKPDQRTLRKALGNGALGRVNAGVYYFKDEIFEYIKKTPKSERGEYEITDTINMLIAEGGNVRAVDFAGEWIDLCYPWDLLKANEILMAGLKSEVRGNVYDGVTIEGNAVIEEGAVVKTGVLIEGNVIIKAGARVGPNCYIRGSTVIGRNCHIGNAVEIKNSIIMDNSNVPHLNYVGDSVICSGCNLGAGTKVANLRLDNRNVRIVVKGKAVDTGSRKIGVFLGDNVKTGINASLLPGTMIGADSFIGPGTVVKGVIGRGSKVF